MVPLKLNFNYTDIFRAPRLALSGKKIIILIKGNLIGYISYFLFSLISLVSTGMGLKEVIAKYGLYPCLFGHSAEWYSWLLYYIGITIWFISVFLSLTAVSRVLLKQLKGNDFFSAKDAWEYVNKHWHAVVFTPITLLLIIIFFLCLASLFALIGKIPILGKLTFSIFYIAYFFGSIFTILTALVLLSTLFYTPSIVGIYEEDTMGSVFQAYSITFSQIWRIITYNLLLSILIIVGLEFFSWLCLNSIGLINYIFGHKLFMGDQFIILNNYSLSLVLPNVIPDTVFYYKDLILDILNLKSGIPYFFGNTINYLNLGDMSLLDTICSIVLSLSYFIIGLSILSYGLVIFAVGESLMFITFKKLSDDDNLILRQDEDDEDNNDLDLTNNIESNSENFSIDKLYEEE
tara:strand:- start:3 stop:1214 length:1212 start_codon:yes stop_codon:yes gene_type:complete